MEKMIDAPAGFVQRTVEGIIAAYGDRLTLLDGDLRIVMSNRPGKERKVGIMTGGDSGHLSLFPGCAGDDVADGCAVRSVFASPSAGKMSELIRACNFGGGVLCLYGDYRGDNMDFKIACDKAGFEDIETGIITAADDVASASAELVQERRGMTGLICAYKIAGAATDERWSPGEVTDVAEKALGDIRSMGVALPPCIVPEVGESTPSIPDDEIETGVRIHGEKRIEACKILVADGTTAVVLEKVVTNMQLEVGDEVSVMINGLRTTPLEGQMILYQVVHQTLDEMGVSVLMSHTGEFATSMEMAGLPVTAFKLDKELRRLLHAPVSTPFYTNTDR